jgi:toxin ParE1/3/4
VPESAKPLRIVLASAAQRDIREALIWSQERFGELAAVRYRDLIKQALRDIAADPERPGSEVRRDLARDLRTYHLFFSRGRAKGDLGIVREPRHFLIYRRRGETTIDVIRVLHDARDLERHLPEDLSPESGHSDLDDH